MNIQQKNTSEVAGKETVMADNEEIYPPPPQNILNVFAASEFYSCSSYDSAKYKCASLKAKVICSSILSDGEFPDACSRSLYIALNNKDISPIMAVTGAIFPKKYANAITLHEQKKKIFSHATSVGNKRKKHKTEKRFSYPILCPLCHLHQRKQIKMKFRQFRFYFTVVCQENIVKKASPK